METKSLVVGLALIAGLWGVLSAWTLTELSAMSIPAAPAALPQIEQPEEIVVEASASDPQELVAAESSAEPVATATAEQCIAL
jgi:hypothetical protein